MGRANRKGRSKGSGRFLMLTEHMMNTDAWKSLNPQQRAVYIEVARLYDGHNNGRLALSVRDAAERARVNKGTAQEALRVLAERGFIECTQLGSFHRKVRHAAEWRLTMYRCDRTGELPSRAFQHWRPGSAEVGTESGTRRYGIEAPSEPAEALTVPRNRTVDAV